MPKLIIIDYEPHSYQKTVHNDTHRYRVLICGRQVGKTTGAINEIIKAALKNPNTTNWYVAPTYTQAERIAWKMLLKYLPKEAIVSKNEQSLTVQLVNNSSISLMGADKEDSLRGVALNFCIMDECRDIKENVWPSIITPMLIVASGRCSDCMTPVPYGKTCPKEITDKQTGEIRPCGKVNLNGRCLFISTAAGEENFIEKLYDFANEEPQKEDWQTWRFPTSYSPYVSKEAMEKEEDRHRRAGTYNIFRREYLAERVSEQGAVYENFSHEHVIRAPYQPIPTTWSFFRTIDYGVDMPTCVLHIAVDYDNNVYVFDEFYQRGSNIDEIYTALRRYPLNYKMTYADQNDPLVTKELQKRGIAIMPATKGQKSVDAGIMLIKQHLAKSKFTNKPKLFIYDRCKNLIKEFKTYKWKAGSIDKPIKQDDHALDALRYFFISYYAPRKEERGAAVPELALAGESERVGSLYG